MGWAVLADARPPGFLLEGFGFEVSASVFRGSFRARAFRIQRARVSGLGLWTCQGH